MSEIAITHPEKVMFPDDGITKGELAAYYELRRSGHAAAYRWAAGDDGALSSRHRREGLLSEERRRRARRRGSSAWPCRRRTASSTIPSCATTRGILWLANQNCITPHVWTSRVPDLFYPDLCVFDLDPLEDDADALRAATLLLRDLLAELGCHELGQDVGLEGISRRVPLDGTAGLRPGRALRASLSAARSSQRDPAHLTQEFYKADRGGRILIDTGRNEFGATYAATYAVRPKPGAPVSAPCTWEEVESGEAGPRTFTLRTMAERLDARGDLWGNIFQARTSLPAAP